MKLTIGLVPAVLACVLAPSTALGAARAPVIGFYSPGGAADYTAEVRHSFVNYSQLPELKTELERAKKTNHKLIVDLQAALTRFAPPSDLSMITQLRDGARYQKLLPPPPLTRIRQFLPEAELRESLKNLMSVSEAMRGCVEGFVLADEPYINGISKTELERVLGIVREHLAAARLPGMKIGVIFAAGMFDRAFAISVEHASAAHALAVDSGVEAAIAAPAEHEVHAQSLIEHRLITYERAGNMYVEGGVPAGFDFYGFDFYLSTLLMDGVFANAIQVLSRPSMSAATREKCLPLRAMAIPELIREIAPRQFEAGSDQKKRADVTLTTAYDCRFSATLELLRAEIAKTHTRAQIFTVTESSQNGALAFDDGPYAQMEKDPNLASALVEDEVRRALAWARTSPVDRIYFFTFADAFDWGLSLSIFGVRSMPSVKTRIYAAARAAQAGGRF